MSVENMHSKKFIRKELFCVQRVEHHSFSIVLMDDPMVENDCFNFSLASRHRYFHLFSIIIRLYKTHSISFSQGMEI